MAGFEFVLQQHMVDRPGGKEARRGQTHGSGTDDENGSISRGTHHRSLVSPARRPTELPACSRAKQRQFVPPGAGTCGSRSPRRYRNTSTVAGIVSAETGDAAEVVPAGGSSPIMF